MQANKRSAIKNEALRILSSDKPSKVELRWFKKKVAQHEAGSNSDDFWMD